MAAKVRAEIEYRHAELASDFGLDWAVKLFGQEAIDSLPKYTRGPRAGKPKGYVHWANAKKGGWSHAHGRPVTPGLVNAWIGAGMFSHASDALEGRARHAAEEARRAADWAEERAELEAERAARQKPPSD